jgi:uncharacterized protein (DUF2126 family)
MPGDSPLGLRLPLVSLPHIPPEDYPYIVEQDPMAAEPRRRALPVYRRRRRPAAPHQQVQEQPNSKGAARAHRDVDRESATACSAPFMPPVERLEDYLELVAAVEATAEEMQMQVHVEGYPPPYDPRVEVIKVTPDPGVIEVNIQPAQSWREAVDITFGLYEDARKTRLGANKFMIDGRHTGTGGGNHVVVGGATPRIRRSCAGPICLKSLCCTGSAIRRCPICSPACSSARPARRRASTRRGTTALRAGDRAGAVPPPGHGEAPLPWLVDRLFRNILVDVTGNTHRAEICIDKLYSPDGADRPARPGRIPRASKCRPIRA